MLEGAGVVLKVQIPVVEEVERVMLVEVGRNPILFERMAEGEGVSSRLAAEVSVSIQYLGRTLWTSSTKGVDYSVTRI